MFQVWGKEKKCERHTTKRSDGQEKTKEQKKPLDKNKMPHFFATMVTL
jgi:hypothetical protein